MKKKIVSIIIGLLLVGPYIGIDVQDMCHASHSQIAIRVAIEKPFLNSYTYGYWNFYIGIERKKRSEACQNRHESSLKYNWKLNRGIWLTQ